MAPKELKLEMAPAPGAIAGVRRCIGDVARTRLGGERADDFELLASEVLTNAVQHGEDETIDVVMRVNSHVALEVTNSGRSSFGRRRGAGEEGGYGLQMVGRSADHWGVESGSKTRVWFSFAAAAA